MADDDYPSTERSHVLVLGTRGSSCCPEQFVRRLLSLQEPDGTESKQEGPPFHWTLTTKYYRAELALHVRHAEPGAAASAAVSLEEGPHGVIVVVDGQQAAGLEAWRSWYVTLRIGLANPNHELTDGRLTNRKRESHT